MEVDKEYIIDEIKRTAEENGGVPLGRQRFASETGIKFTDWYGKHWATWGDAVREAGYEPKTFQKAYNDEYVIAKLIELIREIDKFPTSGEIRLRAHNDRSFPSHNVFNRIGNKLEIVNKIVDYCKKHGDLEDVLEICMPLCRYKKEIIDNDIDDNLENFGFVYLMKSGKHYKIGRSSSADRRAYELKILLPEKVELVHKIRTDDPVGIEAYWHKRFEDKRKSGEWFALTGTDVKAFKRRKFM